MPIKNYTTEISTNQSISEIQEILVKHGAKRVMTEYDDSGSAVGLSFQVRLEDSFVSFTMPVEWKPVLELLKEQKVQKRYLTEEHAKRVAWRIVKNWIDAQMAIIEMRMVSLPQVFLPYANMKNGQTVYENFALNASQLLE